MSRSRITYRTSLIPPVADIDPDTLPTLKAVKVGNLVKYTLEFYGSYIESTDLSSPPLTPEELDIQLENFRDIDLETNIYSTDITASIQQIDDQSSLLITSCILKSKPPDGSLG